MQSEIADRCSAENSVILSNEIRYTQKGSKLPSRRLSVEHKQNRKKKKLAKKKIEREGHYQTCSDSGRDTDDRRRKNGRKQTLTNMYLI